MYQLEAKIRTDDARTTRDQGMIPGVLYGKDVPSTKIALGTSEFIKVYREAGQSQLITLTVDGKKYNTLVQEAQRHPVRGNVLHIDFINVNMKEKIEVQIALTLTGNAPAVLEGGQLHQSLTELTVRCLPTDIVERFEVDISELAMGNTLHVSDLKIDTKKFEIINSPEDAIVSAHAVKAEAEETPTAEGEATEEKAA